jgi:Tol biopolymer transport system component
VLTGGRPSCKGLVLALGSLALLGIPVTPSEAAFPGQNGRIAYTHTGIGNGNIYTVEPDGSLPLNLTPHSRDHVDISASYSAQGGRLVWVRDGAIWIMRADGSNPHAVTTDADDNFPAFSPGGAWIVFNRGDELWLVRSNGTDQHAMGVQGERPTWSPDGSSIAFDRVVGTDPDTGADNFDILTVHRNGSTPTDLTSSSTLIDYDSDWSPDGQSITYTHWTPGQAFDIYEVGANGSHSHAVWATSADDRLPVFSPDGQRIAYGEMDDSSIWSASAAGSDFLQVTFPTGAHSDSQPSWQPR